MSSGLPSTRRSVAVVGAAQVANVASAMAMVVALARCLDVPTVASAAWFLGLVAVVGPLSTAGGSAGMVPLVARARLDRAVVDAVVRRSLPTIALGGLVAWAAVQWWAPSNTLWAWLAVPWVVVGGLAGLVEAAARAAGQLWIAAVANDWPRRLAVTVGVLLGAGSSPADRLNRALLLAALLQGLVLAAGWVALRRRMPHRGESSAPRMWSFAVAQLIGLTVPQAGVLFVGTGGDAAAAADYGVAVRLSMVFTLVAAVSARAAAPRVAAAPDLVAIEPWLRRVATVSTLCVAFPLAGLALAGRWGLAAALGAEYRSAYPAAVLLGAMVLTTVGTGLSGLCLMNRGRARVLAGTSSVATLCFLGAAAVAGRLGGATAVAATALAVIAIYGVVLAQVARRLLGVNVWPSLRRKAVSEGRC